MNSVSFRTKTCALCGDTSSPLYYSSRYKFFWCRDCKLKTKKEIPSLQESDATYYIYALIDPRDQAIRYIGMSRRPKVRLREHGKTGNYRQTYHWICELKQQQLEPILHILEEIHDTRHYAYARETYWIYQYATQGAPLLNILPGHRKSRHKRKST